MPSSGASANLGNAFTLVRVPDGLRGASVKTYKYTAASGLGTGTC